MISYDDAIFRLGGGDYSTVESIFSLVNEVSGKVVNASKDSVYLLYSGSTVEGAKYSSDLGSVRKVGTGRIATMIGWRPTWQGATNSQMRAGS